MTSRPGSVLGAAAFAFLTAALHGFIGTLYLGEAIRLPGSVNTMADWAPAFLAIDGCVRLVAAAVLIGAGLLLIQRKSAGLWLTVGSAVALLAFQVIEFVLRNRIDTDPSQTPALLGLTGAALPAFAVFLAMRESVRNWLAER